MPYYSSCFTYLVLPVFHWSLAVWQDWVTRGSLARAFEAAHAKMQQTTSMWAKVAGPVTALIATLWRVGWTLRSALVWVDDLGRVIDLLADPQW